MAPLTASKQRTEKVQDSQLVAFAVKAAAVIFGGAAVCREIASGLLVPASDTAGLEAVGMSVDELNNTLGANGVVSGDSGERYVRVDTQGEKEMTLDDGSPTPIPGDFAYVIDDDTVTADPADTTNEIILGKFTRPGPTGGWFVDIERRPIDVPAGA